jgi:hypothetical protein
MPSRLPKHCHPRQQSFSSRIIHAPQETESHLGIGGTKGQKEAQNLLRPSCVLLCLHTLLLLDGHAAFKCLRQKEISFTWTEEQQKSFELLKLALVSAPVQGHPEAGQTYQLYTDASDYAIAGALQQIQFITIKDLKGTRAYERLQSAYERKEPVPELIAHLSKEHNDH